jgi:hypothetical protein
MLLSRRRRAPAGRLLSSKIRKRCPSSSASLNTATVELPPGGVKATIASRSVTSKPSSNLPGHRTKALAASSWRERSSRPWPDGENRARVRSSRLRQWTRSGSFGRPRRRRRRCRIFAHGSRTRERCQPLCTTTLTRPLPSEADAETGTPAGSQGPARRQGQRTKRGLRRVVFDREDICQACRKC